MFSTLKARLLLGLYVFLILCIPIGAYLVSTQKTVSSKASEGTSSATLKPISKGKGLAATSSAQQLLNSLKSSDSSSPLLDDLNSSDTSSPTIATSFGPTLSLKVKLEGSPENNQTTKLFVGILEGTLTSNPKFILNFSLNIPADGSYSNLSLAGLTSGSTYTALIKGAAQIASSSEFTMTPNVTNLNSGSAINLTTGDLNEDNTINSADYSIVKSLLGISQSSSKWNNNVDLNKDGVINLLDLLIVSNNLGKTGASGVWISPLSKTATSSGGLREEATSSSRLPVGSTTDGSTTGYWMWIPK